MNRQSDYEQVQGHAGAEAAASHQDSTLLGEQVRLLYTNAPASVVTAILVAVITAAALRNQADLSALSVWLGILIAVNLIRVVLVYAYNHRTRSGPQVLHWRAWYTVCVSLAGIAWGGLGLLLDPAWPVEYQVLVFMCLSGIAAGAISSYAIILPVYAVFVTPLTLLLAGKLLIGMHGTSVVMAPLVVLFTAAIFLIARKHNHSMINTLVLGEEKQQLVDEATTINARLQEEIKRYEDAEQELHTRNRELEQAHKELELSHSQALQSEKLASVGQLAAGIAHEINTPIQFVGDNTRFLQEAFADLMGLVDVYEVMGKAAKEGEVTAELADKAHTLSEEVEVDYLAEEVPKAISQSLEGIERVSKIVSSMKDFSHPGSDMKEIIDINKAIESTLTVSHNEWKYNAEVVTDFDTVLTAVPCYPGEFNQVILNMVVNASHAIADCRDGDNDEPGTITIATRLDGGYAEIRISDTGSGMPEEVRKRIFEPFYTTKGVGKGSGQGLAIAYTVIVDKHGGTIDVDSAPGKGTTFIIRLPMRDSIAESDTDNNPERNPGDEEAYSVC